MSRRVEDIRPPTGTLTGSLEQGTHREVETEGSLLELTYDQRAKVWDQLAKELGEDWPESTAERNALFKNALREVSQIMEKEFGFNEWRAASPGERDMLLGAVLRARYGGGEREPQPKPKPQWVKENKAFLGELSVEEISQAYQRYAQRVREGRIKP